MKVLRYDISPRAEILTMGWNCVWYEKLHFMIFLWSIKFKIEGVCDHSGNSDKIKFLMSEYKKVRFKKLQYLYWGGQYSNTIKIDNLLIMIY